jgi:hypothetical protein
MDKLQQVIKKEDWELAAHYLLYSYFKVLNSNPGKLRRLQNARKTKRPTRQRS